MATKAMILNNDFLEFTQTGLIKLFKPTYNPAIGNNFPLQYYPYDGTKNPVRVKYNKQNEVTNLFLVTENFLKFINKINDIWYLDTIPRVITPVTYTVDATYDYTKLLAANTSETAKLVKIFEEGTANAAARFLDFETMFATRGIMGDITGPGCLSSSIPELFLRHLYSKDKAKREVAFKLARDFYGIPVAEVNSAELEMIPADDFNSDLFTTLLTDDVLTLSYTTPIKFQEKYLETVHNVTNQALYLYFPLITSNAMRQLTPNSPTSDPTKEELHDLISLYTGVTTPLNLALPNDTSFAAYYNLGTVSYRPRNIPGSSVWSLSSPITNKNMPTLTNSIWSSVKGKNLLQAGYTAVSITEAGGGGDIIFDHTDKIEYIDSLTLKIKVPTVYS